MTQKNLISCISIYENRTIVERLTTDDEVNYNVQIKK